MEAGDGLPTAPTRVPLGDFNPPPQDPSRFLPNPTPHSVPPRLKSPLSPVPFLIGRALPALPGGRSVPARRMRMGALGTGLAGHASGGFSLIEIVIAVGIFAFVIIPIIGLVSGGMKTMRQSMDDTVRADIVHQIAGEKLRAPWTNAIVPSTYYYTDEGVLQKAKDFHTIFVANTYISNPPALLQLNNDTNCKLMIIDVRHVADTNNRQVYSQLLMNLH